MSLSYQIKGERRRKWEQCHKCGTLCATENLTSVLYDDPDYVVCEDCLHVEDYGSD